jgi:hypothetical protein
MEQSGFGNNSPGTRYYVYTIIQPVLPPRTNCPVRFYSSSALTRNTIVNQAQQQWFIAPADRYQKRKLRLYAQFPEMKAGKAFSNFANSKTILYL